MSTSPPRTDDGTNDLSAAERDQERREARVKPGADRPPTDDEARAAEKSAPDVDLAEVAEHEAEMQDIGTHLRGEGEIPD